MMKKVFIIKMIINFICMLTIVILSFLVIKDNNMSSIPMYSALALLMINNIVFHFLKKKYDTKIIEKSNTVVFKGLYVVTILLYGIIGFPFPVLTSLMLTYLFVSDIVDYRATFKIKH